MDMEAARADMKRKQRAEAQERQRAIDPAAVNDATPLDAALYYASRGHPVFPVVPRAKNPLTPHGKDDATTDRETIRDWFTRWPDANVAIRTDGLLVVDVDARSGGLGSLPELGEQHTLSAATGGGGFHYLYKFPGGKVGSKSTLPGIDIKADDKGYIVVAPSVHPSGGRYRWQGEGPRAPQPAPEKVKAIIRKREPQPAKASGWVKPRPASPRPGDDFKARATWESILAHHGWQPDEGSSWDDDVIELVRPGKDPGEGLSAVINRMGDGRLAVYSSNAEPFEVATDDGKTYDKLGAYAVLEHGGDIAEAVAALAEEGYGTPKTAEPEAEETLDDAWQLADVGAALDAGLKPPAATVLLRTDGTGLLYPGKVHALAAEPEAGKSWLALVACVERMEAGETVLYIDFEDDQFSVLERLTTLGVPHDQLRRQFLYIRADGPFNKKTQKRLADIVDKRSPSLVVLDGVAEAMVMLDLDENSNQDVAKFQDALPRLFERQGCTVITIDHVTKSTDGRRYARGGGHKLAAVSGAAFRMDTVKPFGRGLAGMSTVFVTKDRPGGIRARAIGGGKVAEFHLDSTGDQVVAELRAPEATTRPTIYMKRVSQALMGADRPLNITAVRGVVEGKHEHIRWALELLVSEGYVDTLTDNRGTARYKHVRPFTEDDRGGITPREPATNGHSPRHGRWVPLPLPPLDSLVGDPGDRIEAEWLGAA